jgi:cyanophycinase
MRRLRRQLLTLSLASLLLGLAACTASGSLPFGLSAPSAHAEEANGYLLIVGGGGTTDDMYARAIELGGGASAKVVIFPQASELPDTGESSAATWKEKGAVDVQVAELKDEKSEAAALSMVESATVIWFPGGVQSRLMKALGEKLPLAIRKRYEGGAVVGGTSAGAAVMSGVMITGEIEGGAGEDGGLGFIHAQTVETERGLGLIGWAVVDQHFVKRRRFNRLLSCVLDNPTLVGIGIDERTSILVHGKGFEVIGESNVLVVDAREATGIDAKKGLRPTARGLKMSLLAHGMRYDARD